MNDKELAHKVVALGIGSSNLESEPLAADDEFLAFWINIGGTDPVGGMTANEFVRDWRVAGALMEKVGNIGLVGELFDQPDLWYRPTKPHAIIEACVVAREAF